MTIYLFEIFRICALCWFPHLVTSKIYVDIAIKRIRKSLDFGKQACVQNFDNEPRSCDTVIYHPVAVRHIVSPL